MSNKKIPTRAEEHLEDLDKKTDKWEDVVNHPSHYKTENGIEAIDVIEAFNFDFCLGNCFKYMARHGRKKGASAMQDIDKAIWYLERYRDRLDFEG